MTKKRLYYALACYGALGLVALGMLEGSFRVAVWVFLAGLAVKSWLALLGNR